MGNNCIFPNYVDSNPQFLLSFPFPEQPNTMATASSDWVGLFFKGGKKERRVPPFPLRQTCGVAAELSRGHTTHIAFPCIRRCTDRNSLALPRLSRSLSLLSTPLTCQFLSCLPLANAVINLFVCLAGRINGPSLEQVLTLLQWTRMEPPNRNSVFHH